VLVFPSLAKAFVFVVPVVVIVVVIVAIVILLGFSGVILLVPTAVVVVAVVVVVVVVVIPASQPRNIVVVVVFAVVIVDVAIADPGYEMRCSRSFSHLGAVGVGVGVGVGVDNQLCRTIRYDTIRYSYGYQLVRASTCTVCTIISIHDSE